MDYNKLVDTYEELDKTNSRLKKTDIIAKFLWEADIDILSIVTLLVQGRIFPIWSDKDVGIANQLTAKIISHSTGVPLLKVDAKFKKIGDYGLVIEDLVQNKKQTTLMSRKLTAEKVYCNIEKLADVEGKGSQDRKFALVTELLSSANPKEAKYIIRTVLNDLRVGVAQGVIRDAISKAFFSEVLWTGKDFKNERIFKLINNSKGVKFLVEKGLLETLVEKKRIDKSEVSSFKKNNIIIERSLKEIEKLEEKELSRADSKIDHVLLIDADVGSKMKKDESSAIEWAWFMRADYGEVARIAKEKGMTGLRKVTLQVGKPCYVLLAEKAPSLENAIQTFENVAIETKYDGMRTQIHKKGDQVWLFTRRLDEVTKQFPDVVELIKKNIKAKSCIIEGESVGINVKNGKPLPFQTLSQRIHRKYDIEDIAKKIPVDLKLFDAIYVDGEVFFKKPFHERRKELEKIIKPVKGRLGISRQIITKDLKRAEQFYKEALQDNQEGVMVKNLDSLYHPGRRIVGGWLKVKPVMENLDLAIIGAMWGTGKRAGALSSFILGCKDPADEKFLECGMMGTGIKEKAEQGLSFTELTKLLKPLITKEHGNKVKVKPKFIVEVAYEEIQKSPNYNSGFALRFPRLVRMRHDKGLGEVDDTKRIKELYSQQRGGR
jgi:DNA ligase-1